MNHKLTPRSITRRTFLGTTLAACAAPYIIPSSALGHDGAVAPSERLNVACIGLGWQMESDLQQIAVGLKQNVVALCDVDATRLAKNKKLYGPTLAGANTYKDYRIMLEKEKSLDAVIIATPDHWHAPICRAAMLAGKHVYCEKPLAHDITQTRAIRELSRQLKVVTQTGNQGSASANLRRNIEVIQAGVLGQISEIHIWYPKEHHDGVRPAGDDPIPEGFDWDFWLGQAPVRPYKSKIYHPIQWRWWYDFGNGAIGDFCCHAFNLPVRALKLEYPTRIEISGQPMGKDGFTNSATIRFHFPQRGDLNPTTIIYYSGVMPPAYVTKDILATHPQDDLRTGCVMIGEKGSIAPGLWNKDPFFKMNGEPKYKGVLTHEAAKGVLKTLPRTGSHMGEWVEACKGGPKTFSPFDLGGHLTEIGLAGNLALRLGHAIDWDGPAMQVKGVPEAAALIKPEYRKGWDV